MSEHMQPEEPSLELTFGDGREFEMRRDNSRLFTFIGKTALNELLVDSEQFNHVFLQLEPIDEDGNIRGTYIFSRHDSYNQLAGYMVENDFPMSLNNLEVPDCDKSAYQTMVEQQLKSELESEFGDFPPEDWR